MANRVDIKVGYSIDKTSLNELKRQLTDLRIEAEKAKLGGNLTKGLDEASKAASKLEDILTKSWNSKLNQLDLSKVNTSIKTTYGSVQNLQKAFIDSGTAGATAYNNFARMVLNSNIQLKQANQTLDKMAVTFKNTLRYGISSSVFNNLSNSIQKAYNYTVQLDSSLNDIRIVTGKSADEMDRFAVRANRVAKELGRSTKDFTNAALIYYQQGLGNEEAQARAEVTMKAANVTGQSGREVSEQLTAVWNGYKVTADEAELYVDKLAAVAATTASDLEELSTGMSKVASAANLMGVDIDQLNAQLATIVSVTRQAPESVGTALKTIYGRMSDIKAGLDDETTLGNYTAQMAQMGINVLNANGNLRDMGEVIEEIGGKWSTMSREEQVALSRIMAGTRQYNNLLSLFDNWDMYIDALETSSEAAGTLQKQQDIYMESMEAHLQKLSTEAEKTYSILFDQDAAKGFIDVVQEALSLVNSYLTGLGGGMRTIATLGLQVSNIFSKQISASITQQLENSRIENESRDVAKLKEEFIASKGYDPKTKLNVEQTAALDKEFEYAQKIAEVQSTLTDEEYKKLTAQQEEIGNLQEQITHYHQIEKEIEKIASHYDLILDTETDFSAAIEETEIEAKKLQTLLKGIEENEWNNTPETQKEYIQFLKDSGVEADKINKYLNDEKLLRDRIEGTYESTILKQEELKKGREYIASLDEDELAGWEAKQQSLQYTIDKTVELKNEQMRIQTIVRGTTTILSTLSSIQGIFTTMTDESLSGWEKFSSIMSVISIQGITLLAGMKEIKNLLPAIAVQLGVIGTEEQAINAFRQQGILLSLTQIALRLKEIALAKIKFLWETLLNTVTGKSISMIGVLAVAAIAALTVAIGAWVVKIIEANSEENRLNETLKKNKEEVQKATEAYKELKDTISSYENARKAIDDLKEGTVEFYDAIVSSNDAAQKLIDTLGLMAGIDYTLDKNGLININQDVINERQFRGQQEVFRRSAAVNDAQVALERYGQEKILAQFLNEINNQSLEVRISSDQAKTILDNTSKTNIQLGEVIAGVSGAGDSFVTAISQNSIDITSAIAKYGAQYTAQQNRIDNLEKMESANLIRGYGSQDLVNEYNKLTAAQQSAVNTYAKDQRKQNIAQLRTGYDGFWDTAGNVLLNGLKNVVSFGTWGTRDQVKASKEFQRNRTLVQEEYAKNALGYKEQNGLWYNRYGKAIDYDKAIKEIDVDTARNAYNRGEFSTEKASQEMINIIRDAKNEAYKQGFEETSQNYIAEAYAALKTGDTYDFSALTNDEKSAVENMIKGQALGVDPGQLAEWLQHNEEVGNSLRRIKEDAEAYKNELEEQAKALDTSSKALELYGRSMQKANKLTSDLTKENAKSIASSYSFNKAYNQAAKTFEDSSDAYETYIKALKNGEQISYDIADSVAELQTDLESMLGLDLSPEFMEENYDQIKTMLTGTADEAEAAYNRIQALAIQDALENSLGYSAEKAAEFVNYLSTLDPGAELSRSWTDSLIEMINNANMTIDDVEKLFASMHIVMPPPDDYEITEETVKSKATSTKHTYKGEIPTGKVREDGTAETVPIEYSWTETTEPVEQKYFKFKGQDVTLNKDNSSSGSFGRPGAGNFTQTPGKNSKNKSGGGGGGSSKAKDPDTMKQITDESDRYHDINIELGNISTKLQRLDSQKKKLFGQDLINATNEEINLLNQQIEATNVKLGLMDEELEELKPKLLDKGFNLDASGVVTNYKDLIDAKIKSVKELIDAYNAMSAEEQEQAKQGIQDAQDDLKETIDIVNKYENLKYKEREDLINDRQKALDEITTRNIEKFNMEVEIRLDMAEAERDWNKFKREIIDGLDEEKQLARFIDARLDDFSSYYAGNGEGSIASLTKQVNSTLAELQKMDAGQANVYGNNRTQGLEDLKKWYTELMRNLEDVQSLEKEIHESYIKMQDQAQKKFDEQIEIFELIGDLIDHDMKVIQMVYGEDSYSALDKYYQKQEDNNNQQLDFYRRQVEFWQKQKDAAKEGSDAWENAKEKWEDAVKNWKDLIINSIEDLQDRYLNTINNIFDKLNDNITNGLGLEYVNEQWTLINKNADQYLDSINALYETQTLENKYLDAIDKTDSVGAQRQLKEIMDAELADLRERDKLTQYDVERANKKYEIALKQIALQEAQQNKTKMRLRRDSQGNYRYEYTSDSDQVSQIQDELNGLYNSLYNFDKARYQENLGQIYDAWSEFQEKMAEAAQINDPQERAERELLLQDEYGKLINGLVEQNSQVRLNLQESAFEDLSRLYDEDSKAYQDMVNMEIDALMNQLVPQWESGVQQMADNFAGSEGFLGVCKQAFEELHNATNDYENKLDELESVAGEDFRQIYNGIDETDGITRDLLEDNKQLINSYKDELGAIGDVITKLDALKTKYNEVEEAAKKAVQEGYEYQSKSNKQAADAAKAGVTGASPENSNRPSEGNTSDSNSDTKSGLAGVGDGNLIVGESATYTGKYYYDSFGTAPVGSRYSGVANGVVVDRITNNPYGIHIHSADGKFMDLGWIKKSQLSGYDTGGYTGTWGNDGRLALLHQKELVLNAKDTENMLNAVTIMRDITSTLGGSILSRLAGIAAANANGTASNGMLDQNVNIQATFPNVTNSREIEDALNNLVNMAAIRANRKGS